VAGFLHRDADYHRLQGVSHAGRAAECNFQSDSEGVEVKFCRK
jgi:hypothetical protein